VACGQFILLPPVFILTTTKFYLKVEVIVFNIKIQSATFFVQSGSVCISNKLVAAHSICWMYHSGTEKGGKSFFGFLANQNVTNSFKVNATFQLSGRNSSIKMPEMR
jgi:hypothetical protein